MMSLQKCVIVLRRIKMNNGLYGYQEAAAQAYWKEKYDDLLSKYIKLEEKVYALKASVDLLKDVALESGQAS